VQNDILKEFLARKTYVFPPGPSLRLVADVIEYSTRYLPRFNPISVCGYHMRQAGCDAVQEIAFTLANACCYVRAVAERGLAVDEFAPRFSFNVSTMRDFFEEIAKHRAIRRLWARIMRERFGAEDPRSWTFRLFSGGDGTSLMNIEPLNNVVRTTLQTLAIVVGRSACPPHGGGSAPCAANSADHRPRERRRSNCRSARRLVLRRVADE
jgi:methylmalonyl-CoA mutase N-terminal domain/subunit